MGRLRKWVNDDREFLRTPATAGRRSRGLEIKWEPERPACSRPVADWQRPMSFSRLAPDGRTSGRNTFEPPVRLPEHQRRQRNIRFAASVVVLVVAGAAVLASLSSYNKWIETRPWAYLVRLSTGQTYPLAQELAFLSWSAPRQI